MTRISVWRSVFYIRDIAARRCHLVKTACVLVSLWIASCVFSYSNHDYQLMSRFQLPAANGTDKTWLRSTVNSLTITNSLVFSPSSVSNDQTTLTQITVGSGQMPAVEELQTERTRNITETCSFPHIHPFDPAVMALIKDHPPINCQDKIPNLAYLDGYTIKVNKSKMAFFRNTNRTFRACRYQTLARKRGSDFRVKIVNMSVFFEDSITLSDTDESIVVECFDTNKTALSRSYFTVVRVKKDLETLLEANLKKHIRKHAPKEVLNVLIIGIDGNSKQNFERLMPKTRNFLLKNLTAIELYKFNTVGGQTFTTVVPMLTGKYPSEMEARNWSTKYHFDAVNDLFLWSDFHKAGYRTAMFLDSIIVTAFHYGRRGWNKPPVDYYLRATLLKMEHDKMMTTKHCVGDMPEITLNHNLLIQLASTFNNSKRQPYFGYSFSADLTHDDLNKARAGDDLYLNFLQELVDKNIINNTFILFFSDHGERFGKIRSTYNGYIESRTPYVFLVFPQWFLRKYPESIKVVRINQNRLTTNFDLYETLRDLLNFQATTGRGDIKQRGISLFQEIPAERTCQDADIPTTYCVCNPLTQANVSGSVSQAMVSAVLKEMRRLLGPSQDKCRELSLKSLLNVMVVQYNETAEKLPTNGTTFYQIMLTTTPGDAVYEAKVTYHASNNKTEVVGDITRLNMYKGQADCIAASPLRQYCYCKT